MKSTKQVHERTCDQCGKVQSDNGDLHIGGSPFNGWLYLEKSVGSGMLSGLRPQVCFDFCSEECLLSSLSRQKEPKPYDHHQKFTKLQFSSMVNLGGS